MVELRKDLNVNVPMELRTSSALSVYVSAMGKIHPLPLFCEVPETIDFLQQARSSPMDLLHWRHAFDRGMRLLRSHTCQPH